MEKEVERLGHAFFEYWGRGGKDEIRSRLSGISLLG